MKKFGLGMIVFGLALSACGAESRPIGSPSTSLVTESTTPTTSADLPISPVAEGDVGLIALAIQDLASRINVPATEIEFIKGEAGYWSDGSLGCPQEGMAYIQVLTQGHRILLRSGDIVYNYHQGGRDEPFLCEDPRGDDFEVDDSIPQIFVPPPID